MSYRQYPLRLQIRQPSNGHNTMRSRSKVRSTRVGERRQWREYSHLWPSRSQCNDAATISESPFLKQPGLREASRCRLRLASRVPIASKPCLPLKLASERHGRPHADQQQDGKDDIRGVEGEELGGVAGAEFLLTEELNAEHNHTSDDADSGGINHRR